MCQSELLDSAQPLEIRMLDEVKQQVALDIDKTVNGIVDNFSLVDQCKNELRNTKIHYNKRCSRVGGPHLQDFPM